MLQMIKEDYDFHASVMSLKLQLQFLKDRCKCEKTSANLLFSSMNYWILNKTLSRSWWLRKTTTSALPLFKLHDLACFEAQQKIAVIICNFEIIIIERSIIIFFFLEWHQCFKWLKDYAIYVAVNLKKHQLFGIDIKILEKTFSQTLVFNKWNIVDQTTLFGSRGLKKVSTIKVDKILCLLRCRQLNKLSCINMESRRKPCQCNKYFN